MLFLALVDDGNAVLQNGKGDDVHRAYDIFGPSACMWSTLNMSEQPMPGKIGLRWKTSIVVVFAEAT